jgi:hypothetical protein
MSAKKIRDLISISARRIQSQLGKLPAETFNFFVKATPKDTGNARRKTKLVSNKTIEANYPYAKRLDEGWSKQAPIGMSKPTERYIKRRLQQIMRK